MSLRGRVVAAVAYVLLLVIVALAIPLALTTSRRIESEVRASARTGAQVVAASASGRLDRSAELAVIANRAAADLGGRVLILDATGRPLADSAGPDRADDTYVGRPEVAAALAGKSVQGTRHSDTLGEDLLYTAVPVLDKGQTVGAVRLTQSVDGVNSTIRRDRLALAGVGAGRPDPRSGGGVARRGHAGAAAREPGRHRPPDRRRRPRGPRADRRRRGAARRGRRVQHDDRPAGALAGGAARLRRERLAPAADTADRAEAAARGGRDPDRRPRRPARAGGCRAGGRPPRPAGQRPARAGRCRRARGGARSGRPPRPRRTTPSSGSRPARPPRRGRSRSSRGRRPTRRRRPATSRRHSTT